MLYRNFLLPALIILSLDAIYMFIFKDMFANQILKVQNSPLKLNYISVILCYILLISGFYYFILREGKTVIDAFILGIVIYGIYETTTSALLKNWKIETICIDTLWGGTLLALTTFIIYRITGKPR